MNVRRTAFALGAVVTEVDLARPLDAGEAAGIRSAWLDHQVLCFPNQPLSPRELSALCARFGTLYDNRLTPRSAHPEDAGVMVLHSQPVTAGPPGDWHADLSHTPLPLTISIMAAPADIPAGGVTIFSNTYLAYESLSPVTKELIEPLEAIHDVTLSGSFLTQSPRVQEERRRLNPPQSHRVVLVHPDTGRRAIYLGDRVREFAGLTAEESQPILELLRAATSRYEFAYHHAWSPHDVVLWDNRCVLHYVPPEDPQLRPAMLRSSLVSEVW